MDMYNYKQILEAINRGIQLALDDFDDEQVQNIKSKQIQNRDYTKEYLDLIKEVVDLGLPSGTLWRIYNLGVNPNQLTSPEDWYGGYYAWGELEPNKTNKDGEIYFNWGNYKYARGSYDEIIKYNGNPTYSHNGYCDKLTQLLPEDDVAFQIKKLHNYKFHIPTKEQFEELINYTQNYWVNDYNPNNIEHHTNDDGINGLNGRVFIGQNGNQLFIPAAGYHGANIYNNGFYCDLWSSSLYLDHPNGAYYLSLCSSNIGIDYEDRYLGFSIRPVTNLR